MSNDSTTLSYTPGGADDPRNPFHYMPTMAPIIVALVCFTIIFVALSVWTIWKRSWYMITLLVACLMEILGYGMRIPLVSQPVGQIPLYAGSNGLIIIAPVLNAAIEYVLLGRLMHAVGDQYSMIKPKLVAWIFIICDIFSGIIQASGAGLLATASTNPASATTGENILLGGLAVNLASFAIFCLQLSYFDYRTRKSPPNFPCGSLCQKGWRQFLYVIYLSSALVLIRQIYRVIEFSQGFTGYLASHEVFFYVFDTIPIFLSATIFVIFFPGNGYLPKHSRDTFDTMYNIGGNYTEEKKGNAVVPANNVLYEGKF